MDALRRYLIRLLGGVDARDAAAALERAGGAPAWREVEARQRGKKPGDHAAAAVAVLRALLDRDGVHGGALEDVAYALKQAEACIKLTAGEEEVLTKITESADLDETSKSYLRMFSRRETAHTSFRAVGKAIVFGNMLRSKASKGAGDARAAADGAAPPLVPWEVSAALQAELDKVSDWASFDVFKVAALSDGRPLQATALTVLQSRGLIHTFAISLPRLQAYLAAVEGAYRANLYHNATHAADVT